MKYTTILIILFSSYQALAGTLSYDSVGIEQKDGKTFILHEVETQETLYSVSRKYNVSIYQIIESNPPVEFGLEVGQIIRIPLIRKSEKTESKEEKKEEKSKDEKPRNEDSKNEKIQETLYTSKSITHTVKPKETLFSLSREYDATVSQLKKWNELESNEISIGQELIVGYGSKKPVENTRISEENLNINDNVKKHIVAQSETLFSISRMYDATIDQIKEWNNLISNEISIGQELIVSERKVTSQAEEVKPEEKPQTIVNEPPSTLERKDSVKKESVGPINSSTNFEEITEAGLATLIEGSNTSRKHLALHRTAKVGTILRVRNEMNDQEVFVRVLGRLPDTGVNKNIVIRISKSAYDRLGAIDPRFRVSISYIP